MRKDEWKNNGAEKIKRLVKLYCLEKSEKSKFAVLEELMRNPLLASLAIKMAGEARAPLLLRNVLLLVDHQLERMKEQKYRKGIEKRFLPWLFQTVKKESFLLEEREQWELPETDYEKLVTSSPSLKKKRIYKAALKCGVNWLLPFYEFLYLLFELMFLDRAQVKYLLRKVRRRYGSKSSVTNKV